MGALETSLSRIQPSWVKSRKRCFKGSHVTLNSFSASWPFQYSTWLRSINQYFKEFHSTCKFSSASGTAENATLVN